MIDQVIGSVVAAGIDAAVRGGPRRQYKWNKRAAQDANQMNRENQQWLLEQERLIQEEQRKYDSPEAQMARYLAAGLNPHMIYGSGSSAGQAFPIHAGNMPAVNIEAPSAAYPNPVASFLGASQSLAQLDLTRARAEETSYSAALKDAQADLIRANPMLRPEVAQQIAETMLATADLKEKEAQYRKNAWVDDPETGNYRRVYVAKIQGEVESLIKRNNLLSEDAAIRAEILSSKKFMNDLLEVQVKWLKDAEVSPEHIRQALMLLFSRIIR